MYSGPLYGECDAEDVECAFADLRRCIELLHAEYDCPPEAIRVWHSGNRGPHFTIPAVICGAEAGHPQLPRIYAAMMEQLFPPQVSPTLDRSVYSAGMGRMWRLPNRRRNDNGRFKVQLSVRELLNKSYAELDALTVRPRKGIFWLPDEELSSCASLARVYQETVATLGRMTSLGSLRGHEGARIPVGQRNAALARLAGVMRRHGASEDAIAAALLIENRLRCDPALPEAEIKRIATSIARYRPAGTGAAASRGGHGGMATPGGIRTVATEEVLAWRR